MDEFFRNSVILANRLQKICEDDDITDDASDKRRYEHYKNMRNIANIKEIAKIGTKRIFSIPDCHIDSQIEIKASYKNQFMKLREAYLRNVGK
ncbi:MAG: hypothetical protein LBB21_06320 [Holosporaceae bacterium]|jgi:hypothetical protein|nr:hypothetical protein [Holosporaceae bacterium]